MRRTYTKHRNRSNKPTVGLALGSGAARGWAHIGVIRALEEVGIRPDVIVGSSIGAAMPGLFAPFRVSDNSLLVDGGLVNPVPVSLARARGADFIIAVNLNGDLVGHHFWQYTANGGDAEASDKALAELEDKDSVIAKWAGKMKAVLGVRLDAYISSLRKKQTPDPGLFDVIVGAIDIMQDRLTRSRMAGEPPDIHIKPRLSHIGLMDFDRGKECIEEGRAAARRQLEELKGLAKLIG